MSQFAAVALQQSPGPVPHFVCRLNLTGRLFPSELCHPEECYGLMWRSHLWTTPDSRVNGGAERVIEFGSTGLSNLELDWEDWLASVSVAGLSLKGSDEGQLQQFRARVSEDCLLYGANNLQYQLEELWDGLQPWHDVILGWLRGHRPLDPCDVVLHIENLTPRVSAAPSHLHHAFRALLLMCRRLCEWYGVRFEVTHADEAGWVLRETRRDRWSPAMTPETLTRRPAVF